jgi:hypothetical protein
VRVAIVAAVLPVVLVACGSNGSDVSTTGTTPTSGSGHTTTTASDGTASPADTAAAARAAGWGDNVHVTFGDGTFRYRSNGVPNHPIADQYLMPDDGSVCKFTVQPDCMHVEARSSAVSQYRIDYTITTRPELVHDTYSVPAGPMGLSISGAPIYNPFEGDGTTVAMNSNFTIANAQGQQVAFMDHCMGHPSPHPAGQYHYHGLSPCLTDQVDEHHGPSHIIGMAFDGFPIYGDRDIDGHQIDAASLDECNGLTSPTPEFPDGIYHYVMLDVPTAQSTVRCLHGRLDNAPRLRTNSLTSVPATDADSTTTTAAGGATTDTTSARTAAPGALAPEPTVQPVGLVGGGKVMVCSIAA